MQLEKRAGCKSVGSTLMGSIPYLIHRTWVNIEVECSLIPA